MSNDLRNGCRTVRFGDVVRNINAAVRNPLEQGIERFVGLEHLDPESLHVKRWGNVADGTSFTRKFVRGQVLFGKRRAYQRKAAVADFDGICSGDILVFEPKGDELLPELLPFVVQSDGFFEHALGTSAGSLSPRTKWSDLARYKFALPPKDEQLRIAEILFGIEDAIKKWFEVKLRLDELEKSVSLSSFSKKLDQNEEILKSLTIKIGSGKTPRGGEKVYTKEGVIFLRSQNIYHDGLNLEDVVYISESIDSEMASTRVKDKDVLLNITGASIGRCTIYNRNEPANVNQHVCIIRPKADKLNSEFLMFLLQSEFGQEQVFRYSTKGNREGLNFQQLGSFKIPSLSLDKQILIVEKFRKIVKSRENILQQLDYLNKLKNKLSTKMLQT